MTTIKTMTTDASQSLFINNQWRAPRGSEQSTVMNPAIGEAIVTLTDASADDVNDAVSAAVEALPYWRAISTTKRSNYLFALAQWLEDHKAALMALTTENNGKPGFEAEIDLDDAIACYRYYGQLIVDEEDAGQQFTHLPADSGYEAVLLHDPVGVVGLITPWNFPLVTSAWKIAPALAAGCTIVFKPSEVTPLPELQLAHAALDIELPPGVLNVVCGQAAVGQALTTHPAIDKVSFTGSNAVGSKIMSACAPDVKNLSLELGGKSPIIVFDDTDLADAVEWIMGGIFFNAGQICSATSRLLVHENIADALYDALKTACEQLTVGNGADADTEMGPMVSATQQQAVNAFMTHAEATGLACLTGGKAASAALNDGTGFFLAPTIYTDVPTDHRLWREEIFGPVLCTRAFATEAEAIQLANDCDFGLAATVVSADLDRANRVAEQLTAGQIWINTLQVVFPQTSWGGFKQSGIGRELGVWGLNAFREPKHIVRSRAG